MSVLSPKQADTRVKQVYAALIGLFLLIMACVALFVEEGAWFILIFAGVFAAVIPVVFLGTVVEKYIIYLLRVRDKGYQESFWFFFKEEVMK